MMEVDGVYIVLKFGDIATNRFGVMGHRRFGRIAPGTKNHCLYIRTSAKRTETESIIKLLTHPLTLY